MTLYKPLIYSIRDPTCDECRIQVLPKAILICVFQTVKKSFQTLGSQLKHSNFIILLSFFINTMGYFFFTILFNGLLLSVKMRIIYEIQLQCSCIFIIILFYFNGFYASSNSYFINKYSVLFQNLYLLFTSFLFSYLCLFKLFDSIN